METCKYIRSHISPEKYRVGKQVSGENKKNHKKTYAETIKIRARHLIDNDEREAKNEGRKFKDQKVKSITV